MLQYVTLTNTRILFKILGTVAKGNPHVGRSVDAPKLPRQDRHRDLGDRGPRGSERTSREVLDDALAVLKRTSAMREYIGKINREDIKFLRAAPHSAEAIEGLRKLVREASELAFKLADGERAEPDRKRFVA